MRSGETLITALPHAGYKLASYSVRPARPTRIVEEGHVVDLGDRSFEVLHLPGHSPGSMGLWEKRTGTLFSGDAIYDGPLLDELEDSNIADYIRTMRRLRELPVRVVHAGHDPSFGRDAPDRAGGSPIWRGAIPAMSAGSLTQARGAQRAQLRIENAAR